MKHDTFRQALLEALARKPFHPFVIHLIEGERLVVGQPEALNYGGGQSALFFGTGQAIRMFGAEGVRQFSDLIPAERAG